MNAIKKKKKRRKNVYRIVVRFFFSLTRLLLFNSFKCVCYLFDWLLKRVHISMLNVDIGRFLFDVVVIIAIIINFQDLCVSFKVFKMLVFHFIFYSNA